jgi:hypothetical protein
VGSEEELNYIDDLIKFGQVNKRKLSDFTNEKYVNSALKDQRKSREEYQSKNVDKQNKIIHSKGYCIRCRTSIKLDLEKPLCWDCYKIWSVYEDPFYKEKFCISCGKENNTNFNRPACLKCFKELKKNKINPQPLLKTQGNSTRLFFNGVAPIFKKIRFRPKQESAFFIIYF